MHNEESNWKGEQILHKFDRPMLRFARRVCRRTPIRVPTRAATWDRRTSRGVNTRRTWHTRPRLVSRRRLRNWCSVPIVHRLRLSSPSTSRVWCAISIAPRASRHAGASWRAAAATNECVAILVRLAARFKTIIWFDADIIWCCCQSSLSLIVNQSFYAFSNDYLLSFKCYVIRYNVQYII